MVCKSRESVAGALGVCACVTMCERVCREHIPRKTFFGGSVWACTYPSNLQSEHVKVFVI